MLIRFASAAVVALSAVSFAASAAMAQSTTRIEPRPFYGAVITLEEGVRVIRPLPPERHVIINPNNTPLSLSFNDTRVYEKRTVRHYHENAGNGGNVAPRYYGGGAYLGGPGIWNYGGGKFGGHHGYQGHGGYGGRPGGVR